jgi:hypothetical protein
MIAMLELTTILGCGGEILTFVSTGTLESLLERVDFGGDAGAVLVLLALSPFFCFLVSYSCSKKCSECQKKKNTLTN